MAYFRSFKKIDYDFLINGRIETHTITNIALRVIIKDAVKSKTTAFYNYSWKDGDRPDIVADRYYGSHQFWWVVFFSNDMFDLYYDFPLDRREFDRYLNEKYTDLAIATELVDPDSTDPAEIKRVSIAGILYAKETIKEVRDEDDNVVVSGGLSNVPHVYGITGTDTDGDGSLGTGAGYFPEGLKEVTLYDFEEEQNEAKREIKLLDNRVLQKIVSEYEQKMNERRG